jgi:Outer membrane protein beta-barrel domain
MSMKKRVLVCVAFTWAVTATNASAQVITNMAKRVGIGGSVGRIFTFDDDVNVGVGFGVNAGLAPGPGLGPTLGFGWYEGDLTLSGISGDAEVGRLRIRPLMAGIGYTWVNGRLATGVSVNAGISFNSIRLNDQYRTLFGPGTEIRIDASNSFAVRPQLRVEYALARKVGVFSSAGYFFTKFDNLIETPVGRFENEWDASSFNIFVGAMVYPFR